MSKSRNWNVLENIISIDFNTIITTKKIILYDENHILMHVKENFTQKLTYNEYNQSLTVYFISSYQVF